MYILIRLIKLLLIVGIIYVLHKVLWKGESFNFFKKKKQSRESTPKAIAEMKRDPVCGTYLPEGEAIKFITAAETHYFCSDECKAKFQDTVEANKEKP
jgi:YHS domain-containing protein